MRPWCSGFQTLQRIHLNTMTLSVVTSKVYTSQGVGISVVGTAQVKINGASEEMLRYAAEQFGSKSEEELTHICKLTMEVELQTKPSQSLKLYNSDIHLGESVTQTQRGKIRYFWNLIFCHLNIGRV